MTLPRTNHAPPHDPDLKQIHGTGSDIVTQPRYVNLATRSQYFKSTSSSSRESQPSQTLTKQEKPHVAFQTIAHRHVRLLFYRQRRCRATLPFHFLSFKPNVSKTESV